MNPAEPLPLPDYERTDAAPRWIVLTGGLLVAGVVLSLVVSALLYVKRYRNVPVSSLPPWERSFSHGPAERTGIATDWAEQERLVQEHLHAYGWVDRGAGIVRIPIERAIDLTAAESAAEPKENRP